MPVKPTTSHTLQIHIDACEIIGGLGSAFLIRALAGAFQAQGSRVEAVFTDRIIEETTHRNPYKLILSGFNEDRSGALRRYVDVLLNPNLPGNPAPCLLARTKEGSVIREMEKELIRILFLHEYEEHSWNTYLTNCRRLESSGVLNGEMQKQIDTALPREALLRTVLQFALPLARNADQVQQETLRFPFTKKDQKDFRHGITLPPGNRPLHWSNISPFALDNPIVLSSYLSCPVYTELRHDRQLTGTHPRENERKGLLKKALSISDRMQEALDQSGDRSLKELICTRSGRQQEGRKCFHLLLTEDSKLRADINTPHAKHRGMLAINLQTLELIIDTMRTGYGVEFPNELINPGGGCALKLSRHLSGEFSSNLINAFERTLTDAGFQKLRTERDYSSIGR